MSMNIVTLDYLVERSFRIGEDAVIGEISVSIIVLIRLAIFYIEKISFIFNFVTLFSFTNKPSVHIFVSTQTLVRKSYMNDM